MSLEKNIFVKKLLSLKNIYMKIFKGFKLSESL